MIRWIVVVMVIILLGGLISLPRFQRGLATGLEKFLVWAMRVELFIVLILGLIIFIFTGRMPF